MADYKKLFGQKATVVDGDKAEILDLEQLLLVKVSFEAKLAELDKQIAELKKLGIKEKRIEPLDAKKAK